MKIIDTDGRQPIGLALHAAGAFAAALLLGGYYCFVYQSLTVRQESDQQRIDQLSLLLSESAAIQRENNRLQHELGTLETVVAEVRKRLPHELRQEEFTADLSRVAKEAGLHVEELNWQAPKVSPTFAQAEVQVACSGSFASICQFLDDVSQLARITDVAQVQMEANPESAIHTFQVTFVLYYDVDARVPNKNDGVL